MTLKQDANYIISESIKNVLPDEAVKKALSNKEFGEGKRQVIQTFLHLIKTDKFDTFKKYPKYAKAYRRLAFVAEKPTKGRAYRNNKVIDMSLTVLTHETATDRLLNPGGFEPQKRMF